LQPGSEIKVKIYTVSGRLIRTLDDLSEPLPGYNYYPWDGRDDDGDRIANGVYLYKIILKTGKEQKEVIEKLVVLR
jgi:flagellar hook assembly protein FlgD